MVCPVEVVPGQPISDGPGSISIRHLHRLRRLCSERPSVYPEDEVPTAYTAKGGERLSAPVGTEGFTEPYDGQDHEGNPVHLDATRILQAGEVIDLTPATPENARFFSEGPGYSALG